MTRIEHLTRIITPVPGRSRKANETGAAACWQAARIAGVKNKKGLKANERAKTNAMVYKETRRQYDTLVLRLTLW